MAYKKQLRDKDGNTIYPDVGLDLDSVVYSDDPTEELDSIIDPNSYSTEERWTGGYWVDGKPIYKKTIYVSSFPNAAEATINHNISNLGQVIFLQGYMATGSGGAWPIPMPPNPLASITTGIIAFASNTSIIIRTGSDRRQYSGHITLWYTKSS